MPKDLDLVIKMRDEQVVSHLREARRTGTVNLFDRYGHHCKIFAQRVLDRIDERTLQGGSVDIISCSESEDGLEAQRNLDAAKE